jgi:adenosylmethionine-8-amino-7-oxononanoate aminotransferase
MESYRTIIPSNFDSVSATSAIDLAAQLTEQTPEHTLTLMDKVFYTTGSPGA